MNTLEADRLRNCITIGERQLAGMVQHLHRLETEARLQRDQIAAAKAAIESLRGPLRVVEHGGWAA